MSRRLVTVVMAVFVGAGAAAVAVPAAFEPRSAPAARAAFRVLPASPQVGQKVRLRATVATATCSGCRYRWEVLRTRRGRRFFAKLGSGRSIRVTFGSAGARTVRLTVTDRRGRRYRRTRRIKVAPAAPPRATPPAAPAAGVTPVRGQPSCEPNATPATTAAQVRSALQAGQNVCVTAAVGDVNLDDLTSSTMRHVGTGPSGSIGRIHLDHGSNMTFRARFASTVITFSNLITIERSIVGGTSASRTMDQLIFIPDRSDDVTIRDNDIGWTTADDTGNTGFGIRAYNESARLRIERNYIHHIGGDGIQLGMSGPDTLVDRNEIAFVAKPPGSSEHSDDLQVTGNGPNMRITNNYLHDNGRLQAGARADSGSGPYIHAGETASLIFENNLVRDEGNFMQVGNLGTGGCNRSNLVFRRNTFFQNGTLFDGAADLHWRLCGGSGNVFERNVVNNTFWNEYGFGASGTTARDNLTGAQYTIDANGECTIAPCNPSGQEPIGYRKPSGVHW